MSRLVSFSRTAGVIACALTGCASMYVPGLLTALTSMRGDIVVR